MENRKKYSIRSSLSLITGFGFKALFDLWDLSVTGSVCSIAGFICSMYFFVKTVKGL